MMRVSAWQFALVLAALLGVPCHSIRHEFIQRRVLQQLPLNSTRATQYFDGYKYMLPEYARRRGMAYIGSNERLRVAIDRFTKGGKLSIGIVGGSISAGQGVIEHRSDIYGFRFADMISSSRKPGYGDVSILNGAVAGTVSMYMSVCVRNHVPDDANIVVVEYAINDPYTAPFDSDVRKAFERLLRKLLGMPQHPAVVLLINYHYKNAKGLYYTATAEQDFLTFASYYGLPALSVRAAVHEFMEIGVEGFIPDGDRLTATQQNKDVAGRLWYHDPIHPDGLTGHKAFAELLYHLYNETLSGLQHRPLAPVERERAVRIRKPMVPNNYESKHDNCLIGPKFTQAVVRKDGFEWVNEAKDAARPKWGFVANTTGSKLTMKVRTMASSTGEAGAHASNATVQVELAYLKSYEGMGVADVTCDSGCKCGTDGKRIELDGHHQQHSSQVFLHAFAVTQSLECVISVTVSSRSNSQGHKVKVTGIMVSEQLGAAALVHNAAAVSYVGDIAARDSSSGGKFTILNHAHK